MEEYGVSKQRVDNLYSVLPSVTYRRKIGPSMLKWKGRGKYKWKLRQMQIFNWSDDDHQWSMDRNFFCNPHIL